MSEPDDFLISKPLTVGELRAFIDRMQFTDDSTVWITAIESGTQPCERLNAEISYPDGGGNLYVFGMKR